MSSRIICNNPNCTDYKKIYVTERVLSDSECCDECGEPIETNLAQNNEAQNDPDTPIIKMCGECREITGNKTINELCNCGGFLKEARVCSNPKCPQKMIPHTGINICLRPNCNSKMIPIPDDSPLLVKDSVIFNDFEQRDGSTCIRMITKYQDLSGSNLSYLVKTAEDFANDNVDTSVKIGLYPKNNGYQLKISGKDQDRCTWCETFGTALYSSTEKEVDGIVRTRRTCEYGF